MQNCAIFILLLIYEIAEEYILLAINKSLDIKDSLTTIYLIVNILSQIPAYRYIFLPYQVESF